MAGRRGVSLRRSRQRGRPTISRAASLVGDHHLN